MEQPPFDVAANLKEYLVRQIARLEDLISNTAKLPILMNLPIRPQIGRIYYFGRIIAPNITAIGFWGYTPTGWRRLD